MSGLTDLDAQTLWSALVDVRDAHSRVPSDADSWDLVAAIQPHVEAIVTRAVNEALTEAADAIEGWRDNAARNADVTTDPGAKVRARTRVLSYSRAADIVRARTT